VYLTPNSHRILSDGVDTGEERGDSSNPSKKYIERVEENNITQYQYEYGIIQKFDKSSGKQALL
jgi:hypothetical protein